MDILIVDDDPVIRQAAGQMIEDAGHYADTAECSETALEQLRHGEHELVLLDLNMGRESGMDLLPKILSKWPNIAVVVVTSEGSVANAVEAMRRGAIDFIEKPFQRDHLAMVLQRVKAQRRLAERVQDLEKEVAHSNPQTTFDSDSPAMQEALSVLFRAADTDASILILGESGTGKTVVAREIHARSRRSASPCVTVNCPALSRELLESELFGHVRGAFTGALRDSWGKVKAAEKGTLFLDEIGELPREIQPKLLRLLQDREYERVGETTVRSADVRIIAATNRDLVTACQDGQFREDLFFRLNVVSVTLPPLRERREDTRALAERYRGFFAKQYQRDASGFSDDALQLIDSHPWPGNLRELRNAIERAVILARGKKITAADLPAPSESTRNGIGNSAPAQAGSPLTLQQLEEAHIRSVLSISKNRTEAAERLGIDAATLYRKRKKLGLE